MKLFRLFVQAVTGAVLLLLIEPTVSAQNQNATPLGATVTHLRGKARFSTDNKTWQPVKNETVLRAGAIIQTADDSTMDLRLAAMGSREHETDIIQISPDSVLTIDALGAEKAGDVHDVELDLRNGEIAGRVRQLAGGRYEIKLPAGIVGVRNGDYRVTSSGMVDALTGELIVASVGANGIALTKTVTAGHRLNVADGKLTETPPNSSGPTSSIRPQGSGESSARGIPSNPGQKGPGLGGALRKF